MSDQNTETAPILIGGLPIGDYTADQLRKLAVNAHSDLTDAASNGANLETVKALRATYDAITGRLADLDAEVSAAEEAAVKAQVADVPAPAAQTAETEATTEAETVDETETAETAAETVESEVVEGDLVLAAAAKVLETVNLDGDTTTTATEVTPGRRAPALASAMAYTGTLGQAENLPADSYASVILNRFGHLTARSAQPEVIVAAAALETDPDFHLGDSPSQNERIIRRNTGDWREARRAQRAALSSDDGRRARLAAICDPATVLRDPRVAGTDATPVSDMLSWLTAGSGSAGSNALSYQYRQPISLYTNQDGGSIPGSGTKVWTETDQGLVDTADPDTWKPTWSIVCPGYSTEDAREVTASWTLDTFTEKSSPELVAEADMKIRQARARMREGHLLWHLKRHAIPLSYAGPFGAVADTVRAVLFSVFHATYRERLVASDYEVILPPDLALLLGADDAARGDHPDALKSVEEVIAELEHATGTMFTVARDLANTGTNGETLAVNPYPALPAVNGTRAAIPTPWVGETPMTFDILIVDPSSVQPFTTGEEVLGTEVSFDQARRNERGWFAREFVGLMKPDITPIFDVRLTVSPNGGRAGFVTPDAAAAI